MMTFTAYNHATIPGFMYGTAWKKDATTRLVECAVASGFTAIDTANQIIHYQEALVGEALVALANKGVTRESLFLQTKFTSVGGQDHRTPYDASADITTQVGQSFERSLQHLHTNYIDSYVLHGPSSRWELSNADWEVWAAMESFYNAGTTKMIGISNVNAAQLTQLCEHAAVTPMVVQNRCYAALGWDKDVRDICTTHNIIYQGFSLLTANREVLAHPDIGAIAKRETAGPAQVIFRFAQQIGMLPLTGTTNTQHMKADLAAEQLTLSAEEVAQIEMMAV